MTEKIPEIHLGGAVLDRSRHICAFFHSKDEEYDVLLPFIKEGIVQGDKACHIVESGHRPAHRRRLQDGGIDTVQAERRGQLDILAWEDAYLRDGYFNQHRMLALIEKVLTSGKAQGYPLTRLVANMEWALEDRPGVADLVEYETRLNYVLPKYNDAVV
jgi:hypothetical protein